MPDAPACPPGALLSHERISSSAPRNQWPRVIVRFAPTNNLLLSGMMEGAGEVGERPAVVDVPHGKGHVVLFSNNPMWRDETGGSYFLVFNALMNWDHLDAGRQDQTTPRRNAGGEDDDQ